MIIDLIHAQIIYQILKRLVEIGDKWDDCASWLAKVWYKMNGMHADNQEESDTVLHPSNLPSKLHS